MKILKKFISRKLLALVIGLIISTFHFSIGVELQATIINLVMAYIGSQGIVDAVEAFKKE